MDLIKTRISPILLVGSQMETGGAQKLLLSQAKWYREHGFEVDVLFLYDKEQLHLDWEERYQFPIMNLYAKDLSKSFLSNLMLLAKAWGRGSQYISKKPYQVIKTFTHHASLFGILLGWLHRIPVRIAVHQGRILGFPRWLEWLHAMMINLGVADCLIACSDKVHAESVEEGVGDARIRVIPNGVEIPEVDDAVVAQIRAELNLDGWEHVVMTVGRQTAQKAHEYYLSAAKQVVEAYPNTLVLLLGDGPLRPNLEQQVETLGIGNNVRFMGIRNEIPEFLALADVFVLSSRWEGLPVAMLEALVSGTAVVSTRVEGVIQVLEDGKNGLLVPLEDPDALAEKIKQLLASPSFREQIAAEGKRRVMEAFTFDHMHQQYAELAMEIAEKKRKPRHFVQ